MSGRIRANEKVHYIASTTFTLDRIYSDLKMIGKGSYGVVCSALDLTTGSKVAIKKITPMAKDILDAKHVLREIRLMRHMGKHENVISLNDLMVRESADELYIVMELLDSDLHRVLQSPQILTQSHFRFFLHQLLCGVKYLHDNRIIHRDLKPGNLLVSRDCKLRITDFGLARERPTGKGPDPDDNIDEPMTEHVVTRWYRPPELMLCPDGLYTYAVDMWSVGCILAEMLGRRPLFPGKNFIDQLTLIFDVIGSPSEDEVSHIQNSQAKKYLATQKSKRPTPFSQIFPDCASSMHDLLTGLLFFEPTRRLTVDECLRSPLFANMGASASTEYPPTSPSFEFSFEKGKGNKLQLKSLIVQEANEIHREYLAKKNQQKGSSNDSIDSREAQTKKRSSSTGRPNPSSSSSAASSNRSSRPMAAGRGTRSRDERSVDSSGAMGGGAHDEDDNASKYSYRSEKTSSTQGTQRRTSRPSAAAGGAVGAAAGRSGIGYPHQSNEKERAKSTGRVNLGSKSLHHQVEIEEQQQQQQRRQGQGQAQWEGRGEEARTMSSRRTSIPEERRKMLEAENDDHDDDEEELIPLPRPPVAATTAPVVVAVSVPPAAAVIGTSSYHQVQSPSRRNKVAMDELEDEISSKKAMSYLSNSNGNGNHNPSVSGNRPIIPRRRSGDSEEEDDRSAVGRRSDVEIGDSHEKRPSRPSAHGRGAYLSSEDETEDPRGPPPASAQAQAYAPSHQRQMYGSGAVEEDSDGDSVDEVERKLAQQYSSHQIRSDLHYQTTAAHPVGSASAAVAGHVTREMNGKASRDRTTATREHEPTSPLSQRQRQMQHPHPSLTSGSASHSHSHIGHTHPPAAHSSHKPEQESQQPQHSTLRKKGLTVPKSPQFSKMSWQRSTASGQQQQQQREQQEMKKKRSEAGGGILGPKPMERKRSTSGLKSRPNASTSSTAAMGTATATTTGGGGRGGVSRGGGYEDSDYENNSQLLREETHQKTRKSLHSSTNQRGSTTSSGTAASRLGRYYC